MEEQKYEALNLKNEYVKLKEKSFWLKCEIECKTKEFEINLYKERENPDCFAVLLDLNTLHNHHTIKYHEISDENDILRKKIEKFQGVENTHEDLFEEVQILKREISENLKKIKDMKNNLKRNSPQESPEFEAQLKTMKSILLSRKEPSFHVKIELDELKLSCENLNTALKIKQDQIEEAEVILLEKEHEINVATNEINDKKEAMKRLSNAILESKAIQAELLKEIRILKNKQKTK